MTTHLPIVSMTLYKHGVGYFRRRGELTGESIKLSFRREEMDDLLKSLTVIDHAGGQIQGVDYDTPQSRQERLAGNSIVLGDKRSLRDLLITLRGRRVQLLIHHSDSEKGILLGLDEDSAKPMTRSLVSLLQEENETVAVFSIDHIEGVVLQDGTAASDLRFFLETALGQETHRSITIRLSPGEHDLEISYIAPAPTWRVSYRLVTDDPTEEKPEALLQGWGIFDNRLEEDLNGISLSLTAGMPVSFVYDLYTPHTPTRPTAKDEDRTAAAPIMFDAPVVEEEEEMMRGAMAMAAPAAPPPSHIYRKRRIRDTLEESVQTAAEGQALGELFQYQVAMPVTVGRGQSAMVPIVSSSLKFKKDLIYNQRKMKSHPVATIRFENKSGLTLERGPVTVLEQGEYVGEAVLPFTVNESEAVISYAVELGIHIKEETKEESHLESLAVKEGYLLQNLYEVRSITYHVDNRTAEAKKILLEHNTQNRFTIFDTPEPAEKTADSYRYQVETTPRRKRKFVVKERFLRSRREELRNLDYRRLQEYFKDKFLDAKTYADLKDILDGWAKIEQVQKKIQQYAQEQTQIYQMQKQVRDNMRVLSSSGEEGKLRSRYVQQLVESEEKIAKTGRQIDKLKGQVKDQEAEVNQMISALGS